MPRFTRQNLKSLGPKKKDHVKQKAHLKESNYLKNRMRQGITVSFLSKMFMMQNEFLLITPLLCL